MFAQKDETAMYQCQECLYGTNNQQVYQEHLLRHKYSTEENQLFYFCIICEMGFVNKPERAEHKFIFHRFELEFVYEGLRNSKLPNQCEECLFGSVATSRMIQHRLRHVFAKIDDSSSAATAASQNHFFFCVHCATGFEKEAELKVHRKKCAKKPEIAEQIRIVCENCPKHFALRSALEDHKPACDINNKAVTCVACGTKVRNQMLMDRHLKYHGPHHTKKCVQCPEEFEVWEAHAEHVKMAHNGIWKYRCGLCEDCLLYTSPSPRDRQKYRMPSSA